MSIHDELKKLSARAFSVDTAARDLTTIPPAEVVEALGVLREIVLSLRQVDAAMERHLAVVFKEQQWGDLHEFDGLGLVEVRRSKNRHGWDHDRAASDWLNAYIESTGGDADKLEPFALLAAFRSAAQIGAWKVGGFKAVGANVDDYCSSEPSPPKVVVTLAKDAAA